MSTRNESRSESDTPSWARIHSKDELEQFFRDALPRIRDMAKLHGYAIGLHGSMRRDLDLIAVPWAENYSSRNELARVVMMATCGMEQATFQWEQKPNGRMATSIPVCWTECSESFPSEPSLGHIDLSVIAPSSEITPWISIAERLPEQDKRVLVTGWEYNMPGGRRWYKLAYRGPEHGMGEWWQDEENCELFTPTHWAPVREPK